VSPEGRSSTIVMLEGRIGLEADNVTDGRNVEGGAPANTLVKARSFMVTAPTLGSSMATPSA
jgi:hypothetical protein